MIDSSTGYLEHLNTEQHESVLHLDGPLLVLAGAGTGKTRVLTTRIIHLLESQHCFPGQILAVTFTNKAAREMKDRLERFTNGDGVWLGTFHAIATRILRRHAEKLGLQNNFTIIGTDDQLRLIKAIMKEQHWDEKRIPPKLMLATIQRWKDAGIPPEKLSANDKGDQRGEQAAQLYFWYQARLHTLNAVDFGDLLMFNIMLFQQHPEILEEYQQRFHYILVDEYQDTNVCQYLWLRLLAQKRKNICCVGDDDQSIYGWRGAEVGNILRFEKDFPGAKIVRLEHNYRSTQHILSAASGVIAHNNQRLGKTLHANATGGDVVHVRALWDERDESRFVAQSIQRLRMEIGLPLKNTAILVRASFQTRAFEEYFMSCALPYQVIGGLRFYERREIRDVIAYIRAIVQPNDDLALERILNVPKRGIGASTLDAIHAYAREHSCSLTTAIYQMLADNKFKAKPQKTLSAFLEQLADWKLLFDQYSHAEVVERILQESGYIQMWKMDKSVEADGRIDNVNELVTALEEFDSIQAFLEHVSLVSDHDESKNDDMVSIMTLHAAKGLEFDAVFLCGWEEGLFPHQRAIDESGLAGLEEERRLAYVGMTRAKRWLFITYAGQRRVYNQWHHSVPSRFIEELPPEHIEHITKPNDARRMML